MRTTSVLYIAIYIELHVECTYRFLAVGCVCVMQGHRLQVHGIHTLALFLPQLDTNVI